MFYIISSLPRSGWGVRVSKMKVRKMERDGSCLLIAGGGRGGGGGGGGGGVDGLISGSDYLLITIRQEPLEEEENV